MKFVDATFTYRAVTLKTLSWSMTFIYPSAGGKKGAGGGVNRITHLLAASNKIQYFEFFHITCLRGTRSHLLLQHCEILGVVLDDVVLSLCEVAEVRGKEDVLFQYVGHMVVQSLGDHPQIMLRFFWLF